MKILYAVSHTLDCCSVQPNQATLDLPLYYVPWTRYQTYGIGILAGLILYDMKKRNRKLPMVGPS